MSDVNLVWISMKKSGLHLVLCLFIVPQDLRFFFDRISWLLLDFRVELCSWRLPLG
jgi:hypothetical protein